MIQEPQISPLDRALKEKSKKVQIAIESSVDSSVNTLIKVSASMIGTHPEGAKLNGTDNRLFVTCHGGRTATEEAQRANQLLKQLFRLDQLGFIANVFFPLHMGTKLRFMSEILSEIQLSLRSNEVNHMKVPLYQEISVKKLCKDALTYPVLKKYLPEPDQLSGKLPERDFFFGKLGTLKNQYMKDVINEANEKRLKADKNGEKKEAMSLSDAWLDELMKHPYHSRKTLSLIIISKSGAEFYLLRESAKVSNEIKDRKMFKLSKRLGADKEKEHGNLAAPG